MSTVSEDETYVDKNVFVTPRVSRKQAQMTDALAEGRFAVVRKAHLDTGKEKSVVAAKALRSKIYAVSVIKV